MNRLGLCQKLIEEARRCLENGDRECVMKLIEELIRNQCHDGRMFGREVADKVKDVVHELWLVSDNECRCRLLKMLKELGVSKMWIKHALHINDKARDMWIAMCKIDWKRKIMRNNVIRQLEDLLRRMGWSEVRMCESLLYYIGIDVEAFKVRGIEPCAWLNGLELLSNLKNPYWLGLKTSDLVIWRKDNKRVVRLELKTTNTIDAVFFAKLLSTIKAPSLAIEWRKAPAAKYVSKSINLVYYIDLNANAWPWPLELDGTELERVLNSLNDEELAEYIAGAVDGDGSIYRVIKDNKVYAFVEITACRNCQNRAILEILKEIIAKRFGVIGNIKLSGKSSALEFVSEKAVRLLRLIRPFVHHPLRRLRAELILALYDGRISREAFEELYKMTEYELGGPDIKHNNALAAAARAAPQTHTHGEQTTHKKELNVLVPGPGF